MARARNRIAWWLLWATLLVGGPWFVMWLFQPIENIADAEMNGQTSPLGQVSTVYNQVGYLPPVHLNVAEQAAAICADIKAGGPDYAGQKLVSGDGASPTEAAAVVAAVKAVNRNLCARDRDDWSDLQ